MPAAAEQGGDVREVFGLVHVVRRVGVIRVVLGFCSPIALHVDLRRGQNDITFFKFIPCSMEQDLV